MKRLVKYLDDILLIAGCFCILFGIAQWSIPITWMIGGGMLIGFAVLAGKVGAKNDLK